MILFLPFTANFFRSSGGHGYGSRLANGLIISLMLDWEKEMFFKSRYLKLILCKYYVFSDNMSSLTP